MLVNLPILLIGERSSRNGQISVLRMSSSSSVPINIWEQKVGDTTNEARTFGLLGCGLAGVGSVNFVG